jgi:hypothetical protein
MTTCGRNPLIAQEQDGDVHSTLPTSPPVACATATEPQELPRLHVDGVDDDTASSRSPQSKQCMFMSFDRADGDVAVAMDAAPATGGGAIMNQLLPVGPSVSLAQFPLVPITTPLPSGVGLSQHGGSSQQLAATNTTTTTTTSSSRSTLLSARTTLTTTGSSYNPSTLLSATTASSVNNSGGESPSTSSRSHRQVLPPTAIDCFGGQGSERHGGSVSGSHRILSFAAASTTSESRLSDGPATAFQPPTFATEGDENNKRSSMPLNNKAALMGGGNLSTSALHHRSVVVPLGASNYSTGSLCDDGKPPRDTIAVVPLGASSDASASVEDPALLLNGTSSWSTMPTDASGVVMRDSLMMQLGLMPPQLSTPKC